MTVSTAYAALSYDGDDGTVAFPVTWPFLTGTLLVTLVSSTGVETVQTISTHYSVTGGTDSDGLPATGTVTMVTAPASGETLKIERVTTKTQAVAFTNGGAFPAKTIEGSFDKLLMIAQEAHAEAGDGMQLVSAGATDYWDAESAIIRSVADGTANNDAVNLGQLQAAALGNTGVFAGAAQGAIVYYDGSVWRGLAPGTSGQLLKTQGAGADPAWETILGTGDMIAANNLSDLTNAATARTNLGVAIGTDVQAYDADLAAIAGLTSAADKAPYFTGSGTASLMDVTSFARTLLDDANAATALTTLGAQASDAGLTSIAGLTTAADKMIYTTASDTYAVTDLTSFARTLLDDASASAARTTLGVVIGTNVQAYDATLTSIAALGTAADKFLYTTGVDTWAEGAITAFALTVLDDADAATVQATLGLVPGTDVQAYDTDLAAIAALSSSGLIARTGAGTAAARTIAAGSAIAVTNGDGVSGNPSVAIDISGLADRPAFGSGDKLVIYRSGSYYKIDYTDLPGSSGGIANGYANVTDGSTTAAASGADTFKMRADTGVTVTVTNNDATHGDNVLIGLDAELSCLAGLTSAADKAPYYTGSGTAALMTVTSVARTLLDDATTAAMRATLDLEPGTDVQAWDTMLESIAGLADPNADRIGFWDDSAGAWEWLEVSDGLTLTTTTLKANFVQAVATEYGTWSSTSTAMPIDDTIPQNTEGAEIMTLAITPKSATNKLRIDVVVVAGAGAASNYSAALFQDSTANALASVIDRIGATGSVEMCAFSHVMDAGTTSATTFKVRAGPLSGSLYFNGNNSSRFHGGVMKCRLAITEYTP